MKEAQQPFSFILFLFVLAAAALSCLGCEVTVTRITDCFDPTERSFGYNLAADLLFIFPPSSL